MSQPEPTRSAERAPVRALLAINAILLAALLIQGAPALTGSAHASNNQQSGRYGSTTGGIVNPADQRKEMIGQLRQLNTKIDAMNKRLSRPFEVRVIQMPAGHESD